MAIMNVATRFVKETDAVTRCIAGETIIVPVKRGVSDLDSIYTLNEVGTALWRLIDGRTSVSQLVQAVSGEYQVTPEESAKDIVDFLGDLQAAGLIWPSAPPSAG